VRITLRHPARQGVRACRGAFVALGAVLLGACGDAAGPRWTTQVSVVDLERSSVQAFSHPSTARVGVPFGVTVTTVGSTGCVRLAGARVTITGLEAEVVPLDAMPPEGTACPRTVRVRFDSPGEAPVRVRARDPHLREVVQGAAVRVEP
jgi:hypothetical protein